MFKNKLWVIWLITAGLLFPANLWAQEDLDKLSFQIEQNIKMVESADAVEDEPVKEEAPAVNAEMPKTIEQPAIVIEPSAQTQEIKQPAVIVEPKAEQPKADEKIQEEPPKAAELPKEIKINETKNNEAQEAKEIKKEVKEPPKTTRKKEAPKETSVIEDDLNLFPMDTCSLEFRETPVQHVLRSLAVPYKINLLVSERVSGKVTASFHDVPVREVFKAIVKDAGLGYLRDGKVLRIDTLEAMKKAKEGAKEVLEPVTKNIKIKYAFNSTNSTDLTQMADELKKRLSGHPKSNISVISRTNTLVVTDLPEKVAEIEKMVASLDKISPQIAIVSKIVSVTSNFSREFGIQWGGKNEVGGKGITVQGGLGTAANSGTKYGVNLPATTTAGATVSTGGAVNFMVGKLGHDVLEVQLAAMESDDKGKVLASPKVITQDNQAAKMESVHKVFYETLTYDSSGVPVKTYNSVEVKINLEVTPHVIEGRIFMDVKVEKAQLLTASLTGSPPDVKTNVLTTKVLIGSEETVVIGGLVESDTNDIESGVPYLKEIPLLGWLFKSKAKSQEKKELMIFITPTIMQES